MPINVGILTYHFSNNYGALLQAYALREYLRREGFNAEFINYHPIHVEGGGSIEFSLRPKAWRNNVTVMYVHLAHLYRNISVSKAYQACFELFRKDNLGLVGNPIGTRQGLAEIKVPDFLICGSDQIWNPSTRYGLDPVYFLDFPGAARARRLSYAASFGRAELEGEYGQKAGEYLTRLDAISVREMSGVDIVGKVSGRSAVCVPDPTLLLGDFSDLLSAATPVSSNHIFCYALRSGKIISTIARHASQILDLPILSPYNPNRRWLEIGTTIYPSPIDWLAYLKSAELVISNSFHGVALSIALRKQFVAVSLPGNKLGLSERIMSLLQQLGLENRMVFDLDNGKIDELILSPIDWCTVDARVRNLRLIGEGFLREHLR